MWNRGTDVHTLCPTRHRINVTGAFLCCQDHRLSRLLSRCCHPEPIGAHELSEGSDLLQLGNKEELLLNAYAKTLGPVYVFERLSQLAKIRTSLGEWGLLKLVRDSASKKSPRIRRRRRVHDRVRVRISVVLFTLSRSSGSQARVRSDSG